MRQIDIDVTSEKSSQSDHGQYYSTFILKFEVKAWLSLQSKSITIGNAENTIKVKSLANKQRSKAT